jgi:hypothetical protein
MFLGQIGILVGTNNKTSCPNLLHKRCTCGTNLFFLLNGANLIERGMYAVRPD